MIAGIKMSYIWQCIQRVNIIPVLEEACHWHHYFVKKKSLIKDCKLVLREDDRHRNS